MTELRVEASGDLRLSKERQEAMEIAARVLSLGFKMEIHGAFLNSVRDDPKSPYGVNIVFKQKVKNHE